MKQAALFLIGTLGLTGCADETISAYGAGGRTFALVSMDDVAFTASATISFHAQGRIEGQGPCNYYFGVQTAPYPWFSLDGVGSTEMACTELTTEATYFDALQSMTISEVSGDALILSNEQGATMVFEAIQGS